MSKKHQHLIDIEKKVRKSKQYIIDELHRRFQYVFSLPITRILSNIFVEV